MHHTVLLCREVFQPALTGILQYTDVNALLKICHTDYMKKKKKLNASSTGKYNKESLLEARYSLWSVNTGWQKASLGIAS